jgi:hypothetical protein
MNLFNFNHRYDFGHDWYVQILNTGRHVPRPFKDLSLFQISVSWNDYPSYPYLQIKSGTGDVLDILFWIYKFGIDITFLGRTWDWNHLEKMDEDETQLV